MRNPRIIAGIIMLVIMLVVALAGPSLVNQALFPGERPAMRGSYRPYQLDSVEHPLGTDGDGRDGLMVFVTSIWPSLQIGLIAGATSTGLGVVIGFLAGYARGRLDTLSRILIDMVLVIPTLPLLLMVSAYIERWDLYKLSLILGIFGWSFVARVIRPQVQSLRERSYVDLAVLSGESSAGNHISGIASAAFALYRLCFFLEHRWLHAGGSGLADHWAGRGRPADTWFHDRQGFS